MKPQVKRLAGIIVSRHYCWSVTRVLETRDDIMRVPQPATAQHQFTSPLPPLIRVPQKGGVLKKEMRTVRLAWDLHNANPTASER
jgi:hypothetical protein